MFSCNYTIISYDINLFRNILDRNFDICKNLIYSCTVLRYAFLKKNGRMIYYSPLFITEKPKNGLIKIHGGTLFDYYFVIDKKMNGKQRTNFIIQQYLEGLLHLIEKYENDKEMKIRGTSYIINKRTAEKIGFKIIETDILQKIILLYNYFNILISNSIAKDKLSFPKLSKTKTFDADVNQLLERKEYIEKLNESLKSTIANKR